MTDEAKYVSAISEIGNKYGKDERKKSGSILNESPLDLNIVHPASKPNGQQFG